MTFTILESVYMERGPTLIETVSSCFRDLSTDLFFGAPLFMSSCFPYYSSLGLKSLVPFGVSRCRELSLAFDLFLSKNAWLPWFEALCFPRKHSAYLINLNEQKRKG